MKFFEDDRRNISRGSRKQRTAHTLNTNLRDTKKSASNIYFCISGLESWILDHLGIRNTGNGELGLGALHLEPPSAQKIEFS